MNLHIEISEARKRAVYQSVAEGSHPQPSFFLLVAVSTLIAAFGLVMNNTAVIIGAMLIAPLMTPIFGIALALVRGDPALLGFALRAEATGVVVSISVAALFGLSLPYLEATPEMLNRTTPNLLDLLVAVFAGLAGAYAMINERLSPVLPGIAISTAIVPPLANSGLALSLGAYQGAWGSFLLFFTNFVSILLVSALIFYLSGMAEKFGVRFQVTMLRRFSPVLAGFIVIGVFLGFELTRIIGERQLHNAIRQVLEAELSDLRVSDMEKLLVEKEKGQVYVLAHVGAPYALTPRQIKTLEKHIEERIDQPAELFLRTTLTRDVSASGSSDQIVSETLDGFVFPGEASAEIKQLRVAEQVIREYLSDKLEIRLEGIESVSLSPHTVFMAKVSGLRALRTGEIAALEALLRDRLEQTRIELFIHQELFELRDRRGRFRSEFQLPRFLTPEESAAVDAIAESAQAYLKEKGYSLFSWSMTILDDKYFFLFEVSGLRLLTSEELKDLQNKLISTFEQSIEIFVRSVPEAVISKNGHTTLKELLEEFDERLRSAYGQQFDQLLEHWR